MKDSYSCIFHYNEYTESWYCVSRINYRDYWNRKDEIKIGVGSTPEDSYEDYKTKQLS